MTDLIKQVGGLREAKRIVLGGAPWDYFWSVKRGCYVGKLSFDKDDIDLNKLNQAIAEYYRTDNCSDIKNHLSPSTEVIER